MKRSTAYIAPRAPGDTPPSMVMGPFSREPRLLSESSESALGALWSGPFRQVRDIRRRAVTASAIPMLILVDFSLAVNSIRQLRWGKQLVFKEKIYNALYECDSPTDLIAVRSRPGF